MSGLQHDVLRVGHRRGLLACVRAPQYEHAPRPGRVQRPDGGVGELLPAGARVRAGRAGPDREDRVEQQYALLRPAGQVAVPGRCDAQVLVQFLVDVAQRRGRGDRPADTEAETVRLPGPEVRVLTEDQDPGTVDGTQPVRG